MQFDGKSESAEEESTTTTGKAVNLPPPHGKKEDAGVASEWADGVNVKMQSPPPLRVTGGDGGVKRGVQV